MTVEDLNSIWLLPGSASDRVDSSKSIGVSWDDSACLELEPITVEDLNSVLPSSGRVSDRTDNPSE